MQVARAEKIIVEKTKIKLLKIKIKEKKNPGAGSGVSFAKGTVGGARICDSSLGLHNEAIVCLSPLSNPSFPLGAFW